VTPAPEALRDRYRGALLGLAAGDAVGTTVEFSPPGTFEPVTDMVGGGPFRLQAGQWTDDTSMALCLAESLIERRGFDAHDQMRRYLRWSKEGYLSSTGHCFDIGGTVSAAMRRFEQNPDGDPFQGSEDPNTAGNGSLMRLAPVPLLFAADPAEAIRRAAESSRTTHATREAVDACRYFAGLLLGALRGASREELLGDRYAPPGWSWEDADLAPAIARVAGGSFLRREPPGIRGSGYVVESLEAALWAFSRTDNFRDGCLAAANLGDDADTTAAIHGQLAGAYYGASAIPQEWRERLTLRERIEAMADGLLALAGGKERDAEGDS
jgi:ADP-ribosyl-[dinitrogen reductase] hydrolase